MWYNNYMKPPLTGSICESIESEREAVFILARKTFEERQAYYTENREYILTHHKEYRDAHREQIRAYGRRRYKENRVLLIERSLLWVKNHPEEDRIKSQKRRALKRNLPCTLTVEQWKAIKRIYKYRCAYCGCKPKVLEQDHVIALTKGGNTTSDNIVPACKSCNIKKGNRQPLIIPAVRLLI
jgi:5-methylcytosine-specific restriction endonuclease McrA